MRTSLGGEKDKYLVKGISGSKYATEMCRNLFRKVILWIQVLKQRIWITESIDKQGRDHL